MALMKMLYIGLSVCSRIIADLDLNSAVRPCNGMLAHSPEDSCMEA